MYMLLNAQRPKFEFADWREELSCKKTTKLCHQFFNEHKKDTLISCRIWLMAPCPKAQTFNPYSSSAHTHTQEGRDFSCLIHRGKCFCRQDVNPGHGNPAFNSLLDHSLPVKHLAGYWAPASLLSWNQERKNSLLSSRAVVMINVFKVTGNFVIDIPYSDFRQIC